MGVCIANTKSSSNITSNSTLQKNSQKINRSLKQLQKDNQNSNHQQLSKKQNRSNIIKKQLQSSQQNSIQNAQSKEITSLQNQQSKNKSHNTMDNQNQIDQFQQNQSSSKNNNVKHNQSIKFDAKSLSQNINGVQQNNNSMGLSIQPLKRVKDLKTNIQQPISLQQQRRLKKIQDKYKKKDEIPQAIQEKNSTSIKSLQSWQYSKRNIIDFNKHKKNDQSQYKFKETMSKQYATTEKITSKTSGLNYNQSPKNSSSKKIKKQQIQSTFIIDQCNFETQKIIKQKVAKQNNKAYPQVIQQEEQFYTNQNKGYTQKDNSLILATYNFSNPIALQKIHLQNGSQYEGEWLKGKKYGKGKQRYADGTQFEGQWKNNKQNGYGILKFTNGQVYEGQFKEGKANGSGLKIFSINIDQQRKIDVKYQGQWVNDLQNGKGCQKWSNGCYYQGMFKNGLKQGQGMMIFQDKSTYQGQFKNNLMHGKGISQLTQNLGIYTLKIDLKKLKSKQNQNNKLSINLRNSPIVSNKSNISNSSQYQIIQKAYKGQFVNGKFEGNGKLQIKMIDPKNCSEQIQNQNILINVYQGQFKNDQMHGSGIYKYYDGSQYQGQFQFGNKNGKGQFTDHKKNKVKGIFKNGNLVMKIVSANTPFSTQNSINSIMKPNAVKSVR